MPIDTKHPLYDEFLYDWSVVRDCYAGERTIKLRGVKYLPYTQGMILDGVTNTTQLGFKMYEAYKLRAVWHDLFREAVEVYMGLLHQKPANIELPDQMKDIRSSQGETMAELLRRINEEQLVSGRAGLLSDLPKTPDQTKPLPIVAMYGAENILNWDINEENSINAKLLWIILDESGHMHDGDMFKWTKQTRYRVGMLGTGDGQPGEYSNGLFVVDGQGTPTFTPTTMVVPKIRGKALDKIPFDFINPKDLLSSPDTPPLLGLANAMLAIYRGEADYRQNLFMQGQDTLVTIGSISRKDTTDPDAPLRTGAGAWIQMDADGDAKYIGVDGAGLPEQRMGLQNDRQRAEVRAGQLINARVGDKESGEALKTRVGAQTATLKQIALTGAMGLENQLKRCAEWLGFDANVVKVKPNEDFTNHFMTGQDMSQLADAKDKGLPISYESLHAFLYDRGITKKTFLEEFEAITKERSMVAVLKDPVAQANKQKELDNSDPANRPPPAPAPAAGPTP